MKDKIKPAVDSNGRLHQKSGVARRSASKISAKSKHYAKIAHHHVARRPHIYLHQKYSWYRRWHNWRWHNVAHIGVVSSYILIAGAVVFSATNAPSYALSSWQQSNWDGGVGTNTSLEYASATNIDATTTGQLSLDKSSNSFSNPTLDSNITGWNGVGKSHNTATKYSGAGSTQVAAGVSSALNFYSGSTITGVTLQRDMRMADVNGDGRDDVISGWGTSTASSGGIAVHLTNNDGTLAAATTVLGSFGIVNIAVGDIDQDGDIDIVGSYDQGGTTLVPVYYNNGSGTFTLSNFTTSSHRQSKVELADINNDGRLDLLLAPNLNANLFLHYNNGSGSFGAVNLIPTNAATSASSIMQDLAIGDINGDGATDVVYSNGNTNACYFNVLLGSGGSLEAGVTNTIGLCGTANATNQAITLADFNEDGYDDIAFPRRTGTGGTSVSDTYYASVLFGAANGSLGSQIDLTALSGQQLYSEAVVGDFDDDGNIDFATSNGSQSLVSVYMGNGNGTFDTKVDYSGGSTNYQSLTVGSLNGDGRPDLVVSQYFASPTTGSMTTFINRTLGDTFTQPLDIGNTDRYQLEAYVYTSGAAVTDADAQLFRNGQVVSTTYTSVGGGWYKLTGKVTATDTKIGYGVIVKQGKTAYVDSLSLYKYASSGTLESAIFDLSFGGDWDTLAYTSSGSGDVEVKVRTGNVANLSDATAFSSCSPITSGTDLTGQSCVDDNDRYVQYQVGMTAVDGDTSTLEDLTIQYDPYDNDDPITNASDISMAKANGGSAVASNGWTNGSSPYFAWTAGADNVGGSGLLGYCAYLGTDNTADPTTTKGLLGTSATTSSSCPFVVPGNTFDLATAGHLQTALTTSDNPYYLNLRAIDIAGNIYPTSSEQFQFRFDNTPPSNPAFVTTPSQYISSKSTSMTWPTTGGSAASDANSGVIGLQYQIGSSGWYGDDHSGSGGIDDLLANDGSYTTTSPDPPDETNLTDGVNTVYVRTWDAAGNTSSSTVSAAIKINTSSAPSAPQGVGATPTTNTTNSFAFNWSEPASFLGSAENLEYCYTVNTLPNVNNCTFTDAGDTELAAGAYANQPGENTLYVVAKDESSNINYSNYATVSFFANTSAPGIPLNADIADVSVKATSNWRLAVTWDEPSSVGAGVQSYKIYRSTDNVTFSQVGSSTGTSYVDASLSQLRYYYYVKACDSANNCGAQSSTVNKTPTGKFTSAASMTSAPKVSDITTKRATINWSTDRASDSKIAIGTSSNDYSPSEIGNSDQVTAHSLDLDNLAAGTTYYFKAKWTDEDGNTGSSQEYSFKTAPAPVLKEVNTTNVGLETATIEFTTKDAVKVDLNFGQNESFGGVKTINTSASESTYQLSLTGLNDGTKYLYKISMYDSEGGVYASSIFTFTTPPRPSISNLRFQPVDGEPTSTQKVTWSTNVPTSSIIEYTKIGGKTLTIQSNELKTNHSVIIRGLEDSSKYSLIAQGRDNAGNLAQSDSQVFETALDTRPPEITEVVIEPSVRGTGTESRGQIVVSWKTDEPSTSQVAFGEGSNVTVFNNRTAEDGQLTTEHLVIVSDLPPSKVYSIAPESRDKAGNKTTAESQAAIIGRATDSVLSIVLNTLKNVFGL